MYHDNIIMAVLTSYGLGCIYEITIVISMRSWCACMGVLGACADMAYICLYGLY